MVLMEKSNDILVETIGISVIVSIGLLLFVCFFSRDTYTYHQKYNLHPSGSHPSICAILIFLRL